MTLTAIRCQRLGCGGTMELQNSGQGIERISELVCSLCGRTPEHAFDQVTESIELKEEQTMEPTSESAPEDTMGKWEQRAAEQARYLDEHRDEILADRLSIGHARTLVKWKIPQQVWYVTKGRWISQSVKVFDLRTWKGNGHKEATVPSVLEGEEKLVSPDEKLPECKTIEHLLLEAEYRGYRQAIIDMARGSIRRVNGNQDQE